LPSPQRFCTQLSSGPIADLTPARRWPATTAPF